MFRIFRKKPQTAAMAQPQPAAPDHSRAQSGEEIADAWMREMALRTGDDERPLQTPAWALLLRSPYVSWQGATSWLGGVPCAPQGFAWPRGADGLPLHFLAQIDLAALRPNPDTGARAPGLPATGALLVFVNHAEQQTLIVPQAAMAAAEPIPPPGDLAGLDSIWHWSKSPTFTRWPVDPLPFTDDGSGWPAAFPRPFDSPSQWITTWAMARTEAAYVLDKFQSTQRQAASFRPARDPGKPLGKVAAKSAAFYARIAEPQFQELHSVIQRWHDAAAAQEPGGKVDQQALAGLFAMRRRITEGMDRHALVLALRGWPSDIWNGLRHTHRKALAEQDVAALPPGLRDFFEAIITSWRGHRLFGLLKTLHENDEDRRGHDLFLSISGDDMVGTQREHTSGTSIWLPRAALVAGQHKGGLLIHHSNG